MSNILSSAAKIVFVLVAVTACVGLFTHVIDSKDFMALAMMAFAFYFGTPSAPNADPNVGAK